MNRVPLVLWLCTLAALARWLFATGWPQRPRGERILTVVEATALGCAFAYAAGVLRVGLAVTQQPEVDVVQRKGQAHAQPEHAGRHLGGLAGSRQVLAQRERQGLGGAWAGHGFRLAFAS